MNISQHYYNLANGNYLDALFLAIGEENLEAVKALIPFQKDINARNSAYSGFTPLMEAVSEDSLELVNILVESGAYVNIIGNEIQDFPLNIAALGSNREIYNYLAPLTSPGLRIIAAKTWQNKIEEIEIPTEYYYNLVDGEPPNNPYLALFWAIMYRDWKAAAALIPIQEDINRRGGNYMGNSTFLICAVEESSLNTVKLLIEAGADVNIIGNSLEDFALNIAAFDRNWEIFDYLAPLTSSRLRAVAEITLQGPVKKWKSLQNIIIIYRWHLENFLVIPLVLYFGLFDTET